MFRLLRVVCTSVSWVSGRLVCSCVVSRLMDRDWVRSACLTVCAVCCCVRLTWRVRLLWLGDSSLVVVDGAGVCRLVMKLVTAKLILRLIVSMIGIG